MRFLIALLLLCGVGAAAAAPAAAQGAWRTYQHPGNFTDLIALRGEMWCASSEGGLLRYDRQSGTFDEIHREIGGLASNRLAALALDRAGNLWIGTNGGGLSRLSPDRTRWALVNSFDGLPTDTVQALEAQGDTVWVGTSRGVALWNGREIAGSLPDPNNASFDATFPSASITGIAVLGDELWLATRSGVGMAHISAELLDWIPRNSGIAVLDVQNLETDGRQLFAHSGQLLYVWSETAQAWQPFGGFGEVHSLSSDFGFVLAGTQQGVFQWNGSAWVQVPGAPAASSTDGDDPEPTADPDGVVFAGWRGDLYEQRPAGTPWPILSRTYPVNNDCVNVIVDGARVYLSTRDNGIARFDGAGWRNWPINPPGPMTDTTFFNPVYAYCLYLDSQGHRWAACHDLVLEEFDDRGSTPQFTHRRLGSSSPTAFRHTRANVGCSDGNGGRWFGMFTPDPDATDPNQRAAGLDFYDSNGDSANFRDGRRAHGLAYDPRADRLWVGYIGAGVEVITPPATASDTISVVTPTLSGTSGTDVHAIVIQGDTAWVLGPAGLRRYSTGSMQFRESIAIPAALSSPLDPYPMDVAADGSVWIGTQAGVHVVRPNQGPVDYTAENSPLASNNVRALRFDRATGHLWIATTGGLNRFDPAYVVPVPPPPPRLDVRVWPNPAQLTGAGVQLRLAGNAGGYVGEIYDLGGRRLNRFDIPANGRVFWNGRDEDGRLVPPGVYFVRARAAGRDATVRIALLR